MKPLLALLCLLIPLQRLQADASAVLPTEDRRAIRELESRSYGAPHLSDDASKGEAVEALAGLAGGVSASAPSNYESSDYDALFALLQRYREDLLKMGMSVSDFDDELKLLKLRADQMSERLDQLKPKDGLKIHGRVYSVFDDLHILGDDALPGPQLVAGNGPPAKPSGVSERYQVGLAHSELQFEGTRGPFTGHIEVDGVDVWGYDAGGSVAFREVYFELKLPVVVQFGDIDASISPLTLWRHEDSEPFEPQPFADRRQRLEDDLHLASDEWRLHGVRLSTDLLLFGKQRLELEWISSIAGYAGVPVYDLVSPPVALQTRFNTYMDGWRVGLPLWSDQLTLSYNGLQFWDVDSTSVNYPNYRSLDNLVQTGRVELKAGIFRVGAEVGLSGYVAPSLTYTAVAPALTGTAMVASMGVEGALGSLKVFGRQVSSGYFAPGAQGRTEDWSYQYLGPFLTENSQVGANGAMTAPLPGLPKFSYASSLNTTLLPPGLTNGTSNNLWQHLLAYSPTQLIDPYGDATPNRQGFGAEGRLDLLDGTFKPLASYESFQEIDSVSDTNNAVLAPFAMTRLRVGGVIDLKPRLGWPLKLDGGWIAQESSNGAQNAAGVNYDLLSTETDGGVGYEFSPTVAFNIGYRHLDVHGLNETFDYTASNGDAWDLWGLGLVWKASDTLRLDLVYSQQFSEVLGDPSTALEVDQGVIRLTFEF